MCSQHQILIDHITKVDMPVKYKMSNKAAFDFICNIDRCEASSNPTIWIKAVRCVLINFGFDEDWVNNDFYDLIYGFYYSDHDFMMEDE